MDAATWLPELVVVPEVGESEADSAARTITPGAIHLYDRDYHSFPLIAAHDEPPDDGGPRPVRAEFVLRLRDAAGGMTFAADAAREPSAAARRAGVVSDAVGRLPGGRRGLSKVILREVVVAREDGTSLRLLTNLLSMPPEIVALLYKHRWQAELFFRRLKCDAHFNHLVSHSREGVLLSFDTAVIGVLLRPLHTGSRPHKYGLILLGMPAAGTATLEELLPILRERQRQIDRDRASAARRRARKNSQGT